ncbi:MAG: monofunctional biosynthetic peptidoglycan transglycosylase [Dokdonella sp.]
MASTSFFSPRRWFRLAVAVLFFWLLLSSIAVLTFRFLPVPTTAFMVQRWVEALVGSDDPVDMHYRWTAIDMISPRLPISLIAAEDQKFPIHNGFDMDAIRSALDDAEEGERLRGASTISQQVAKNLFLWNGRSFVRKGIEAYYTVLIEALWPKQRIIEVYLNIAEFGDGIYGATAASEKFFGIAPAQLSARQSALLAAVLPNPRKFQVSPASPYVQRRASWIERQARQLGGEEYLQPR